MSGHTPGPWVAERHDFYDDGWIISDAEIYRVAMVPNASGKPENEANARLIAAAPELLTAAVALREAQRAYMADRGNNEKGRAVAFAAEDLDAAIAKATQP